MDDGCSFNVPFGEPKRRYDTNFLEPYGWATL